MSIPIRKLMAHSMITFAFDPSFWEFRAFAFFLVFVVISRFGGIFCLGDPADVCVL